MGTLAFAVNDVLVKTLGQTISPFQLAFFRYAVGFGIMMPIFWQMGWTTLRTSRPGLHMLRLGIACLAQLGVFVSVVHLPLADATSLAFSRILFTTLLAIIILREVVNRGRWLATLFGFLGVIVMVRPGGEIDPVAGIAIAAASAFALANILITRMSDTEPPGRILFYYQFGGALVFLGPSLWFWQSPGSVTGWAMAVGIGVLTTIGMTGFVRGFAVGEASVIGPVEYIRLIFAALFGLLLFGEVPDIWTIIGAVIIVGSTTMIARSNRAGFRRARHREQPDGDDGE